MIVTVTMNPAIDKTIEIDRLQVGGLNRIRRVEYDAGGKGINVSKTIRELGGESIATGFLGGDGGRSIARVLEERGIEADFVWVEGQTRTNTKVFEESGEVTELNEPGPSVSDASMRELLDKLEGYAAEGTLFVLSGSVPAGVDKGIYGSIIERVHARGAQVLLDADGELFRLALSAGPDMIKPNRAELEELAGLDYRASEQELLELARGLRRKGIGSVVISMGRSGALFVDEEGEVKSPALSVKAHSTVGAGDAMVAAMAYAWQKGIKGEARIRLCIAASAGAVTTQGTKPPSAKLVDELMEGVELERLPGQEQAYSGVEKGKGMTAI